LVGVQSLENEPVDKMLKRFKKKYEKTGILRELRNRAFFEKKSVARRRTVLRAAYRERLKQTEE